MNGFTLVAPWALAGLALVALPILIHLMGKSPARALKFPSLRFVTPSQLLPRRRSEVRDPLLLALRVLALALAVFALAAPARRGAPPVTDASGRTVVVVVDTSRSVIGSASERAARIAELTRIADSAAGGAVAATVLRTADLRAALTGAAARLATAPGERTLLIVSDFQRSAVDSAALATVPAGVTVATRRLPALAPASISAVQGSAALTLSTAATATGVEARWVRTGAAPRDSAIRALASAADRPVANALISAATTAGVATRASSEVGTGTAAPGASVVVIYASYDRRDELERASHPATAPWQRSVVARLAAAGIRAPFRARADGDSAAGRLLIFTDAAPASDDALELALALRGAFAESASGAELESRTVDDATLARWQRPASAASAIADSPLQAPTHGPATRWLWLAALALLAIEWWARRRPAPPLAAPADARS